ncbi:hypothetical protein ABW21_db0201897 [Orbilia brochopaga]|nr:hypothetical protein ABW21_db0201897 [Drechslerella brochopaga]
MATAINSLPLELQSQIISYLPFQSQIFAGQVSDKWQALIANNRQTRYEAVDPENLTIKTHKFLTDRRSALVCKVRRGKVRKYLFKYDPAPAEQGYNKTRSEHLEIDITNSSILDEPVFLSTEDRTNSNSETPMLQRKLSIPQKNLDAPVQEFADLKLGLQSNGKAADGKADKAASPGTPTYPLDITLFCQGAYHPRIVQASENPEWIGEPAMSIRTFAERAAKLTDEKIKESSKELHTTLLSRNSYNVDFRLQRYPATCISVTAELYSNYIYAVADKRGWADSETGSFFLGVDPEDTLRYYY